MTSLPSEVPLPFVGSLSVNQIDLYGIYFGNGLVSEEPMIAEYLPSSFFPLHATNAVNAKTKKILNTNDKTFYIIPLSFIDIIIIQFTIYGF